MAALVLASSLLARLIAAAPVRPGPAADEDPARALLPIDGLFPKLFGQMVRPGGEEETETIAPALIEASAATQPAAQTRQTELQQASNVIDGLVIAMPLARPIEAEVAAGSWTRRLRPDASNQTLAVVVKAPR